MPVIEECMSIGPGFASFSSRGDVSTRLEHEGLAFFERDGEGVVHRPTNVRKTLNLREKGMFDEAEDFDVFEIDEHGKLFKCFSNRSDDNVVFITGRCNSACIMCPDSDKARSIAGMRDINCLLEMLRYYPSDARHLTITGGEPFLIGEDMFVLLQALKEKFVRTEFLLLTNGRAFAIDRYCEALRLTSPKRLTIGIPLHGFDPATHDGITRVPGSFDQTMSGLKQLLVLGMGVELRIVVSRITAEYISRIADLIVSELTGVSCVKVVGLEMLGNAALNKESIWIPYSEAFCKSKPAIVDLIAHGIDVGLYNFPLCAVEKGFWPICEKSISGYKVRFDEECDKCSVRNLCGGLFAGSRRFASKDIRAIGDMQSNV